MLQENSRNTYYSYFLIHPIPMNHLHCLRSHFISWQFPKAVPIQELWEELPMTRKELLNDEQWEKLEPLLPQLKSEGRPWRGNREVLEGILWILRTGAPWNDLPKEYPSSSTCWRRLRKWEEDGTWLRVWRAFLADLDQQEVLDWEEAFVDGSFAPAKKGGSQSEKRSGAKERSGWWWSTAKVFLWEAPFTRPRQRK